MRTSEGAMRFDVVSLFPQMIQTVVENGVTARAFERGLFELHCWNPRDWGVGQHRAVDDRPYGGGPGMVLQYAPLKSAVTAALAADTREARVIALSPQGRPLTQEGLRYLGSFPRLVLVCGRYEGIDERFLEHHVDEEWSIGDYVLSGGELGAMVIIDACARLLPGALGHEDSAEQDSFAGGLLDCPHYTRPDCVDGLSVPDVLLTGHHAAIERWRRREALGRTWHRRPDLLAKRELNADDEALLDEYRAQKMISTNEV